MLPMRIAGALVLTAMGGCAVVYSYGDYEDKQPLPETCTSNRDCNPGSPCATSVCSDGKCVTAPLPAGIEIQLQEQGDCKRNVCDGNGNVVAEDDPEDDNDDNECTLDQCENGSPVHDPADEDQRCGESDATHCDGRGNCVGCTSDDECGAPAACMVATCQDHRCTSAPAPQDTECGEGAGCTAEAGWFQSRCDGQGTCETRTEECAPFVCRDDGCVRSCSTDEDCLPGNRCRDEQCRPCITCNQWLQSGGSGGPLELCTEAGRLHDELTSCICDLNVSSCGNRDECWFSVCRMGLPPSEQCLQCNGACQVEYESCRNN